MKNFNKTQTLLESWGYKIIAHYPNKKQKLPQRCIFIIKDKNEHYKIFPYSNSPIFSVSSVKIHSESYFYSLEEFIKKRGNSNVWEKHAKFAQNLFISNIIF
jgi:hypothetical protein